MSGEFKPIDLQAAHGEYDRVWGYDDKPEAHNNALSDLIDASQVTALWALGLDAAGWPLRDSQ